MSEKRKSFKWCKLFATIVVATVFLSAISAHLLFGRENDKKALPAAPVDSSIRPALKEEKTVEDTALSEFIKVVPIVFHAEKYKEFPVPDGNISGLRVSPDGQKIVFINKTNGGASRITTLDASDGKIAAIDLALDDYADPSWNNDGTKILFAGKKNGNWEIYWYDRKSAKLKQVTSDPNRKKLWPRFSPYKFDGRYRIAYVSEAKGRKDIWWVRESGQYDMPITQRDSIYDSSGYWPSWRPRPTAITEGGDRPEWSPSGNLLLYHTQKGHTVLGYHHESWWEKRKIPVPSTENVLGWSPNQTAFLAFDPRTGSATVIRRDSSGHTTAVVEKAATAVSYFPDGQGFAYSMERNGQSIIAIQPFDDPLGNVSNLWMYSYSASQKNKMGHNQLLFLDSKNDQIYYLFDSERYDCGRVDPGSHARPFFVTSDAVLETFYAAFAALYAAMERSELVDALQDFSREGMVCAIEKKASRDVVTFFETGLALLKPEARETLSPEAKIETARVENASGEAESLFDKKLKYDDFFIRGKYERDTAMQGYFRAIKWYQAFTLRPDGLNDRKFIAEILAVSNTPKVYRSLQRIYDIYNALVGESRYRNPLNLKEVPPGGTVPLSKSELPWIKGVPLFRLLPSIYTFDAYVFDELVTHADRKETVGTGTMPRMLPKGLDIMASLGSDEAFKILSVELNESRFANYDTTLLKIRDKVKRYSQRAWNANLYQEWLYALEALVKNPSDADPAFTKTSAWKRKELYTSLGSWVNLRYETIAVVEQGAAECGEGGYERLHIGKPKGYVEPNPEFFHRLDAGFAKINTLLGRAIKDSALRTAAQSRVSDYRKHVQSLENMARKELNGQELSDAEYSEILNIGGVIEHFILIMGSLNRKTNEYAIGNPDPIRKIVDVQKDYVSGVRLYEALGYADEMDVAVPFYGRRQIAKGPVYSYYEFTSPKDLASKDWRGTKDQLRPSWIAGFYDGRESPGMYGNSDF